MSLLGLYDFEFWPWDEDCINEDDQPVPTPEILTVTAGRVWWSATEDQN